MLRHCAAPLWQHCLLWGLLCKGWAAAQVVVNEVMPIPPPGEPEWVELYNTCDTLLELGNWWIADLRTAVRIPQLVLPPSGYAVLTRDTTALREVRLLPEGVVLLELRLPTLNNTSDAVILRKPDSTLVDSLFYTMRWGRPGISLERRDPSAPAWSPENLLPCQAPGRGTPGEVNSVTPLPADYAVELLEMPSLSTFRFTVLNAGTAVQGKASVRVWVDTNRDGAYTEDEQRVRLETPALGPGQRWREELAAPALWGELTAGWYDLCAAVELPGDMRRWNDTLRRRFYRSTTASLSCNELLYDPLPGGAEFVELINTGNDTLVLEGWSIHTWRPTPTDTLTIRAPLSLAPGALAVIAWDSAIVRTYPWLSEHVGLYIGSPSVSLKNTGDVLLVRDPNGIAIDSVPYSPRWHDPAVRAQSRGLSLEKLNPLLPSAEPSSWSSCGAPEGGTPGRPNSIAVPLPTQGTVRAAPNPFQLSAAELRYCLISYELPFQRALVTVRLFDEEGVPLRTLAHGLFSASQGFVRWDGRTERGELFLPGVYVVVVEAFELGGGRHYIAKLPLVVTD